jgi:hypothetical protein
MGSESYAGNPGRTLGRRSNGAARRRDQEFTAMEAQRSRSTRRSHAMRKMSASRTLIIAAAALSLTACATNEEWAEWKSHPTHFASGDHGFFSIRNREGASQRVTRADVTAARDQSWWGKPITVSSSQILEN